MRNARLLDGRLVDLLAEDGRWTRIGEALAADGADELDAEARLVDAAARRLPPASRRLAHGREAALERVGHADRRHSRLGRAEADPHRRGRLRARARDRALVGRAGHALHSRACRRLRRERGDGARAPAAARRDGPPLHRAGDRVPAGRHLRARRRRGTARARAPARRRLRRRDPALRADVRARAEGGSSRVRAREAVLAPDRRALRRDGRPELALPRGDGRRHREVRARRPRHRVALHGDGLVRAVLLVEAARVPAPRRHQHRRQSVRELADPGAARRLSEAARLRAAEGAARRGRQRLARQRRDHGSLVSARAAPTWSRPRRSRCTSRT